jgi:hypothetical protein
VLAANCHGFRKTTLIGKGPFNHGIRTTLTKPIYPKVI